MIVKKLTTSYMLFVLQICHSFYFKFFSCFELISNDPIAQIVKNVQIRYASSSNFDQPLTYFFLLCQIGRYFSCDSKVQPTKKYEISFSFEEKV